MIYGALTQGHCTQRHTRITAHERSRDQRESVDPRRPAAGLPMTGDGGGDAPVTARDEDESGDRGHGHPPEPDVSHVVLDDLGDLIPWKARTAGGAASNEISIDRGTVSRIDGNTMTIRVSSSAEGHRVERTILPADLTKLADLELWVRSDRPADGSEARPFYLELRLGSTQLAIGAGGNDWHRLIPLAQANVWQPVPLALDDLPAQVRNALTQIRLTCVEATVPFAFNLDAILAVKDELLNDVDAALLDWLGGKLKLGNTAVPAIVEPAQAPNEPFFRIRNYSVVPAPQRSPSSGTRTDFTGIGFSIRPPSVPFDLFYTVEAATDARADAATMLEFALAKLTPRATLAVNGRPLTVESIDAPPLALTSVQSVPTVYVKVATAQQATAAREPAVPPFNRIDVEVDRRASA
jgi:hypothetical protein